MCALISRGEGVFKSDLTKFWRCNASDMPNLGGRNGSNLPNFRIGRTFLGSVPASICDFVCLCVGGWSANFLATPHNVAQCSTV